MKKSILTLFVTLALAGGGTPLQAAPVVFSATGSAPASIQGTVDAFRASLGTLNANVAGSFGSGRREINWDGVPDAFSAPNNLPANFFNSISPRGVEFTTPGVGFQVSANAGSVAPVEFGNIDPSYPGIFATFSAQRLFSALGSNVVDVRFFIPGSTTQALTNGFGIVFTDVDLANTTGIEFFDALGLSLGSFFAPNLAGQETLSFLGVQFTEGHVISRARVISGNSILAGAETSSDLVVMDDFIYGEPTVGTLPEPATPLLLAVGLFAALGVGGRRVQRSRAAAP